MLNSMQPARQRPSVNDLLETGLRSGSYFDTPLIRTAIFLDNITVKDSAEKVQFFKNLSSSLDTFPESFAKGKVMPVLMNAIEFGSAGPKIFPMILQIADKHLATQEYSDMILPLAQRLMNSPDRSIRNIVLESLEGLLAKCGHKAGNDKLFPHVVSILQIKSVIIVFT
jgi:SCY1-like protein 1